MNRIVIIDDEKQARQTTISLLKRLQFPFDLVGEGWDIHSAVKAIQESQPDLIFLDIQLKDGNGFQVLDQISAVETQVVFITAYDQHAIQAFQLSAFGYLLKPIDIEALTVVLEKFKKHQALQQQHLATRTKILIEHFDTGQVKKIVLQNIHGFKVVNLDQILYLKGEVNYTRFFLEDGTVILTSRTLKEYGMSLLDFGFFRIHQSYLVNLSKVIEYIKGEGGMVVMKNGDQLTLSRRRKQAFIKNFIG